MAWWKAVRLNKQQKLRRMLRLTPAMILAFGILHYTALQAQNPAPCPADNLDTCTRYQHLAAGMDSGDLVVQLSSLRDASKEIDPALRALIFEKALKSADLRLRTAGLRYILASRSTFDVVVEAPVRPTPIQDKFYKEYSMMRLQRMTVDEKTDEINGVVLSQRVTGSMIRGGFELGWLYCRLRMGDIEESVVRGTLRCQFPNSEPAEFKASIELS